VSSFKFIEKLKKREHVELVCTGDSITQRTYHTHGSPGYPERFNDYIREKYQFYDVFLYNTGRSGGTTLDLLPRIERDVIRFAPDFATVMIGINDAKKGEEDLPGFKERLTAIVRKITDAGIELMLMTQNCIPPGLPDGTSGAVRAAFPMYAAAIRDVAREWKVPLCDVYADFKRRLEENFDAYWYLLDDPIHPNETGHTAIADLLRAAVGL